MRVLPASFYQCRKQRVRFQSCPGETGPNSSGQGLIVGPVVGSVDCISNLHLVYLDSAGPNHC